MRLSGSQFTNFAELILMRSTYLRQVCVELRGAIAEDKLAKNVRKADGRNYALG